MEQPQEETMDILKEEIGRLNEEMVLQRNEILSRDKTITFLNNRIDYIMQRLGKNNEMLYGIIEEIEYLM